MSNPGMDPEDRLKVLGAAGLFTVIMSVYAVAHLAAWMSGSPPPPANPFSVITGAGNRAWMDAAPAAVGIVVAVLVILAVLGWRLRRRMNRKRKRGDEHARHMGRGKDLAPLIDDPVNIAAGFGLSGDPGLPIGMSVVGNQPLWMDWEAVGLQLWSPRKGKTSTQSIRHIVSAPGIVLATTNKGGRREIVAATRGVRETRGAVWVMDPQGIAGEPAGRMWWNPLGGVTDVVSARALAKVLADSQRQPGAQLHVYFDNEGPNLLANMLLAAAADARPITDVLPWLDNANDAEPVRLLRQHGYPELASSVQGVIDLGMKGDGETRGGVYRTAAIIMSWLASPQVQAWCTPGGWGKAEFVPETFVRSQADTLYLLSREGEGTTAPLITALTVAVCEAAMRYARTRPDGRMPTPMVVELDEAANICKWADLPKLYSHLGSQGVVTTTYLQSWAQGQAVWGRDGMAALWGASNVAVIGPGLRDAALLRDLSESIGDHDITRTSHSSSRSGHSRSITTERRRILSPAALANLPKGRMVVLASGAPPVIAEPVSWWDTEHAEAITASQKRYAPGAEEGPSSADDVVAALGGRDVPSVAALRDDNPWAR